MFCNLAGADQNHRGFKSLTNLTSASVVQDLVIIGFLPLNSVEHSWLQLTVVLIIRKVIICIPG